MWKRDKISMGKVLIRTAKSQTVWDISVTPDQTSQFRPWGRRPRSSGAMILESSNLSPKYVKKQTDLPWLSCSRNQMYFKQRNLYVGNFKFILQFPIAIQPILWVSYHRVPDSSLREGVDCSPNGRLNPGAPGSSNDIKICRIGFSLSSELSEKLPGLGWMMRLKQCRSTKISQLVPAYHNLVVEQLKSRDILFGSQHTRSQIRFCLSIFSLCADQLTMNKGTILRRSIVMTSDECLLPTGCSRSWHPQHSRKWCMTASESFL
jgi:hypothetical protein